MAASAPQGGGRGAVEGRIGRRERYGLGRRPVESHRQPLVERPCGGGVAFVDLAAVHGRDDADARAFARIDVAAGRAGEPAQEARRLAWDVVRRLRQQLHEVEAGLHRTLQLDGPGPQGRHVAWLWPVRAAGAGEQRLHVSLEVPPVAAGAPVRRDASCIGPATHCVGAHAERTGDFGDA